VGGLAAHRITPACPPCFTPSAPVPDGHTVCPPPTSRRKRAAETGDAGYCRPVNNAIEANHGRLKSRLQPMRGLKQLRCARVISTGHAFIQNIRRGHYQLGAEEVVSLRALTAFDELALAI
jgi:DDE superfamily endonuclease